MSDARYYPTHFWDWFAGFCDGEASFCLMRGSRNGVINARVSIALRADDVAVLEFIQKETQAGIMGYRTRQRVPVGANPQIAWEVLALDGCKAIRDGLSGKMRAKKANDFLMWSEAINILDRNGGGQNSPEYPRLLEIKAMLSDVKRYDIIAGERAKNLFEKRKSDDGHYLRRSKWSHTEPLDVDELRGKYTTGEYTQAQLATEYGIHRMTANKILKGVYRPKLLGVKPDIR